jgi:pyruvate-ferredoxin/flavodoxin oxidoreductase
MNLFRDFIMSEVRYNSLNKLFPESAGRLFEKTEQDAKERYEYYKKLAEN